MDKKFTSWLPLILFATCLLAAAPAQAQNFCDVNRDGVVNGTDITIIANYILSGETDAAVEAGLCPNKNHPHLIDMGSAGKWACCNVGAITPFDYGGYYAWGEIEEKSNYTEDTYAYYQNCSYVDLGDIRGNKQYDVAAAKWGGACKMPTFDRIKLLLGCSHEWTTMNEVNGRVFTASNGNRIFLPAAGYRYNSDLCYAGSYGYYWSSTPDPSCSGYAYGLRFSSTGAYWGYYGYRYYGLSVRPVAE